MGLRACNILKFVDILDVDVKDFVKYLFEILFILVRRLGQAQDVLIEKFLVLLLSFVWNQFGLLSCECCPVSHYTKAFILDIFQIVFERSDALKLFLSLLSQFFSLFQLRLLAGLVLLNFLWLITLFIIALLRVRDIVEASFT